MTVMEPRVAERRKTVSEDKARRRLKWILAVIVLVAVVVGSLWLIRSPLLSIRQVEVSGASNSDPVAVVASLDMSIGTPTIGVDGSAITKALLEDPWISSVTVEVSWPGSVTIDVVEHTGVAAVRAGGQWMLVSLDGAVLVGVGEPVSDESMVDIDLGDLTPGDSVDDEYILGALFFLDELRRGSLSGVRVSLDGESLTAAVAGHLVRLGRPRDMAQKAVVLETLIGTGLEPGAFIDLIAPTRPAVSNPVPEVEVEE